MAGRRSFNARLSGGILAAGLMAGGAAACIEGPPGAGHEDAEATLEEPAPVPPARLTVFADKAFYLEREEPEETLVGVLRRVEVRVGPNTREMPIRLVVGEEELSVYTSGFDLEALRPFLGERVEVVGKRVDLGSEGYGIELWVAAIGLAPR